MRQFLLLFSLWTSLLFGVYAGVYPHTRLTSRKNSESLHLPREDATETFPALVDATQSDLEAARLIVKEAIAEMTIRNKARLDNPVRNQYKFQRETHITGRNVELEEVPALLDITPQRASAAALLAEAEAAENSNGTSPALLQKRAPFWMQSMTRRGTSPWGDDSSFQVFRNVEDFGADKTGAKDSTAAINDALTRGRRCGDKCNGSTTKNAIVYFPSGTYLVSSTLEIPFGTQIIGDAGTRPKIVAASTFIGLGVLSTNKYIGGTGPDGGDAQYFVTTANFYRQIRNINIDITATDPNAYVCAIHYQVAQATSLQFVDLIAKTGTTQQGMFSENGSGGVMADVTFRGGNFGFYGGNQQFSADRMTFIGCKTAVQIIWDWGWVWRSLKIDGAETGFRLRPESGSGGNVGSVSFIDSEFNNVGIAIEILPPSSAPGSGSAGIILDNTRIGGPIKDTSGNVIANSGYFNNFVIGPVYKNGQRTWSGGSSSTYPRAATLQGATRSTLDNAPYFDRPREQYLSKSITDFVSVKAQGAKGDGVSDDTAKIQQIFNDYGNGDKIIFVDAGVYMLSDTVVIPKNAKIVGETWAQFAAYGSKFADAKNPRVMLSVGVEGDVGNVEIQDLILTTQGGTAGVVLMEWNVKAQSQGSAALWDVHARIGGATGTKLTHLECPAQQATPKTECQAASMMLHLNKGASGYFDNMWLWVADHMIDDLDLVDDRNALIQCSIYVARGFLIESQEATWLYGTSSEHSVLYQYNFNNARNIFTTMIQTESPYYQPKPAPPAPFTNALGVGGFTSDPSYTCAGEFSGCDESWAVILKKSQNIHIGGAGTYSWFNDYNQDCIDTHTCQKVLWNIADNYNSVRLQHVISIGAKYTMVHQGQGVLATDNLAITTVPQWCQISIFDVASSGAAPV